MYEIWMTDSAETAYKKLDAKLKERLDSVFQLFEEGQFQHNNISALHGPLKGNLRYRMGQWRIVFQVNHDKQVVRIVSIMPRGEDYKL